MDPNTDAIGLMEEEEDHVFLTEEKMHVYIYIYIWRKLRDFQSDKLVAFIYL